MQIKKTRSTKFESPRIECTLGQMNIILLQMYSNFTEGGGGKKELTWVTLQDGIWSGNYETKEKSNCT